MWPQKIDVGLVATLLILIFLLFIAVPAAASAPTVIITDYKISPSVLIPGEEGIITVTVKNTADQATLIQSYSSDTSATTSNVAINAPIDSVTMVGKGIEVISGGYNRVGELGPGQSIPISFLIRAPSETGVYFPEVWIRVSDAKSLKFPIPVNVNSEVLIQQKPRISIEKQLPESVVPGNDFSTTVVLENTGQLSASNLKITVNSSTSSITSKTPSTFHIAKLGPGEKSTHVMEFSTDKKSPLGLRPVNLVLEFQEPDGSYQRQVEILGINIRGKAQLDISQITTDPARIKKGDQFTLIIRIENTGTDDAKSVDARIEIPVTGTKEAFVGKIEPGNDAPAPFNLQADQAGEIPYTLTIQYEDDYGTDQIQQDLHLNIDSNDNFPMILGIVFILLLAGTGAYWYLIRRKPGTGNV
jgi:hypothetical protein